MKIRTVNSRPGINERGCSTAATTKCGSSDIRNLQTIVDQTKRTLTFPPLSLLRDALRRARGRVNLIIKSQTFSWRRRRALRAVESSRFLIDDEDKVTRYRQGEWDGEGGMSLGFRFAIALRSRHDDRVG
jgi:hypothetical protein